MQSEKTKKANILITVLTGMTLHEFSLKILNDYNEEFKTCSVLDTDSRKEELY
jgi:hypothetical protein